MFRKWLEDSGYSRSSFATKYNLAALTVSMWTTGRMAPSARRCLWLLKLCGIPIEAWWQPERQKSGKASTRLATGTEG